MATYPIVASGEAPFFNPNELGVEMTVDGNTIIAVPALNAVTGDIIMGSSGFEADDPYVLCQTSDIETFGDLHGKIVVIGTDNYKIRNVREKQNTNLTRLVLSTR